LTGSTGARTSATGTHPSWRSTAVADDPNRLTALDRDVVDLARIHDRGTTTTVMDWECLLLTAYVNNYRSDAARRGLNRQSGGGDRRVHDPAGDGGAAA